MTKVQTNKAFSLSWNDVCEGLSALSARLRFSLPIFVQIREQLSDLWRPINCRSLWRGTLYASAIFFANTLTALPAHSAEADSIWSTLGTGGGPTPQVDRARIANLLMANKDTILFDAGDGVVQRLVAAKVTLDQVDAVVLSHLHPDHTGGLSALLSLRWQLAHQQPITIYGPAGTTELVGGILASLKPAERADVATTGLMVSATELVKVEEIECLGETTMVGRTAIKSVRNSHFTLADGTDLDGIVSCAFRIDAGDRSIVYTGDTGPSLAVEELAKGAELLVSEVIDVPATLRAIEVGRPNLTEAILAALRSHMVHHHLLPEEIAKLAVAAGIKQIVLTHVVPGQDAETDLSGYTAGMSAIFGGPITVAKDLDRF